MSDTKNTLVVHGVSLSPQDAIDFLAEVGLEDVPCPICGTDDWGIALGPGDGTYAAVPTQGKGEPNAPRKHIPLYTTECRKCGYTRFHNLLKLKNWKKAKGEQA